MKTSITILTLILTFLLGWQAHKHSQSVRIIGIYPDDRGYISVTYIQDGKEYGYDYLTPAELTQLINEGRVK